jgi:hypothetical protein
MKEITILEYIEALKKLPPDKKIILGEVVKKTFNKAISMDEYKSISTIEFVD